jgi:transposase-like protein
VGGRAAGDYPRSLPEFFRRFPDDEACLRYLVETRWPDGFQCPACGATEATFLAARRLWQCRACRRQSSATAGTVLHRSHLPLTAWFTAAFLMAGHKPGVSALQLQHLLGLPSFHPAWTMLQKLRRAMVNPDRSPLSGEVEVDETWVGGKQAGLKGGRQRKDRKALLVVVAVERRSDALGRLRLEVIPDASQATLRDFITRNVAPGSTIVSDAWTGYGGLAALDYTHRPLNQSAAKRAGGEGDAVPGVHRVISNLKTWLRGTHHGVGADHLDAYLDEFVFRFNRRRRPFAGFATLLGLGSAHRPVPASAIVAPFGRPTGARGRATGQSSRRWASPAPSPDPAVPPEPEPWFSHEVREHETEAEFLRAVARLVGGQSARLDGDAVQGDRSRGRGEQPSASRVMV